MAKKRGRNSKTGRAGERFVRDAIEDMGGEWLRGESDLPSIDGQIQLIDSENDCNYYLAYQVKTGPSYFKKTQHPKYISIVKLETEDIYDWKSSNIPVIIIWVNLRDNFALWGEAAHAKPNGRKIKVSINQRFNKQAIPRLLEIARNDAGMPSIHRIRIAPLFPEKVSDIKKTAWAFYSNWRMEGAQSKLFGEVSITLKCWRHVTRPSVSQKEIIHKLSLLPFAKEVLQNSTSSRLLRLIYGRNKMLKVYAVTGIYRTSFQANVIVDVVIHQIEKGGKKLKPKLVSFYERRSR